MFLETIQINRGEIINLPLHQQRMEQTANHFGLRSCKIPDLLALMPDELKSLKVKCRISYLDKIQKIDFAEYKRRTVNSLQIVESQTIDYSFKFEDRTSLLELLEKRQGADEILITKNGFLCDTSYSNIVLRQGSLLFTPDTYLLNGTKRQFLLAKHRIEQRKITVADLHLYDAIYLINAMLDIEDEVCVKIENINY